MNDIQASMLIPQFDKIDKYRLRRNQICEIYENAFRSNRNIGFPQKLPNTIHARHIFTILVDPDQRDEIIYQLQQKNIGVAVNFRAIHLLSYYKDTFNYHEGDLPIAESIGNSTITIPLYIKLTTKEIKYVIDKLLSIAESINDKE